MAYADIAALQQDPDFATRTMACYATEIGSVTDVIDPASWQVINSWAMAAKPGFGDAYASALVSHPDDPEYRPGNDPAVITDGQILSAVQSLMPQPTPVEPDPPEETP